MESPTKHLQCNGCFHVFHEDDAGPPVYECSSCGVSKAGEDEDARRCDQCHRFMAKVADRSCPECEAADEEFTPASTADIEKFKAEEERRKLPPSPEEVAARDAQIEEHRQRTAVRTSRWDGPGSLVRAFAGLSAEHRDSLDVLVGNILGPYTCSLSVTLSESEARAVAERILGLQAFRIEIDRIMASRDASLNPEEALDRIAAALATPVP